MSYYTGQGDYYSGKGDPGLFSSIAHIVGGVAKTVGSVLPGPIGGIASTIGRTLAPSKPSTSLAVPSAVPTIRGPGALPVPGFSGTVQRVLPGGATGYAGCYPGYHLNKTDHYNRTGFVAAGSTCVKNRRMNPANPKALRRAIRRERAFIGLARRTLKGTGYTIKKTGTYARKTTRRRRAA